MTNPQSSSILVFGLGRSGLAVCNLLKQQGHSFYFFDEHPKDADLSEATRIGGKELDLQAWLDKQVPQPSTQKQIALCVAAPGIPYDHPKLIELREHNVETIGEVEWVYRNFSAPIIGITGTAGKGSVTAWLTDVLRQNTINAVAGGNIDPALSQVASNDKILVTELSSFQLERCPRLKPSIAIALNLGVDHIDRHGSLEAYHTAKKNLIKNQTASDVFIYNANDANLREWTRASKAKLKSFSVEHPNADAYLAEHNNEICLFLDNQPLVAANKLALKGKHQLANALAVILAAQAQGLTRKQIADTIVFFAGLEGRYSYVGSVDQIDFIEDSIATRTLAVKAALSSTTSPIVWIAGGVDKGAKFDALEELIKERVSLFIGIGEAAESFAHKVTPLSKTTICSENSGLSSLNCAVKQGIAYLQKHHQSKGTILLAPLASSFDQFQDYKERAKLFRQAVHTQIHEASAEVPN